MGLLSQVANTHNIARVFEGHHLVGVEGSGPCVFPGRKQILREVEASDVVGMRASGEQIQDVLIFPAITHQIIQHENPRSKMIGEKALNVFRDALVEMNSFAMQVPETSLGFSVAVHDLSDGSVKSTGSGPQQLSGKCRFAALTGSRHNDAARCFEIGIIVRRSHHLQMNTPVQLSVFLFNIRNKYSVELVFWTRYIARNSLSLTKATCVEQKRFY